MVEAGLHDASGMLAHRQLSINKHAEITHKVAG
jgi:hypothetical protein